MKKLSFVMFCSLIVSAAAAAHGSAPSPVIVRSAAPAWFCPFTALCAPLPTPRPAPTDWHCPPNAVCAPLPKTKP